MYTQGTEGVEGGQDGRAGEKATLEKQSCTVSRMLYQQGAYTLGSWKLKPYKAEVSEDRTQAQQNNW